MSDDPILDEIMRDFPPEERDDPKLREAMKGTFEYQRLALVQASREFAEAFIEQVGGAFKRVDERRDAALRRWWRDPR